MRRALGQLLKESHAGIQRRRFLVLGCLTCAVITAALCASRLLLEGVGPVAVVLAVVSALYAVAPLTLWLMRSTAVLAWAFPAMGALGIAAMASVEGGLLSEALYWLPFTPMVAVLTRGLRGAVVIGGLAVTILGVLCGLELSRPSADPGPMVEPVMLLLRAFGIGGAAIFGAMLAAIWELDRRQQITAMKRARKMAEDANAAKSRFLASMSHELRTPLNSILGFSSVLLKNRSGNLDPTELDQLRRINKNGRRLLALVNDVLDMSRLETQRVVVELEEVMLDELIAEVAEDLSALVIEGQQLVVEAAPVQPVRADRERLGQVLINLVGNAIKFTPEGTIRVHLVSEAEEEGPGRALRVDVIDTGIGIAPDQQDAIFEPFQQAEKGTSRSFEGTGLGLSIARNMCRLMGFDIVVVSERRRGSVFSVMLSDRAPLPTLPDLDVRESFERAFPAPEVPAPRRGAAAEETGELPL